MAHREQQKNHKTATPRGVFEKVPGSGVWWIRYFDAQKQKHREKVGSKANAIKLYQIRKAAIHHGEKMPANMKRREEPLSAVIDRAISWYQVHRPKSNKTAEQHLTAWKEGLGYRAVADLKPADIDEWLAKHKDWAPGTFNRYKTTLGRALQLEVVAGNLERNVARLVTARQESKGRVRWLKEDEEKRLVEVIKTDWPDYTQSFLIALHTGMRQGEQYSLEWDEIDLERKRIFLDNTKNGSNREVPMNKTCLQAFQELHDRRPEGMKWVFLAAFRKKKKERLLNPRQWFDQAVSTAKIHNFHWHDLRHTFCSRLVMAGVDLLTVSRLAGHSSVAVTQRYAHLSPKHLADAVDVLDKETVA